MRALVHVPMLQAIASGNVLAIPGVPKDGAVMFLERVIVANGWLQEYRVSICSRTQCAIHSASRTRTQHVAGWYCWQKTSLLRAGCSQTGTSPGEQRNLIRE